MKISIFTLCDYAQNNQGKLSIIGTFNRISSKQYPFTYIPSFCIVAKISSYENVDSDFEVLSYTPSGDQFLSPFKGHFQINVDERQKEEQSADFIINITNQEFKSPGTYKFVMKVGDIEMIQDLYLAEI